MTHFFIALVSNNMIQSDPAITPYKNMLADPNSAANFPNARESGSNDALSSKPAAKKAREFSAADTWTCKSYFLTAGALV
jgi:hypothetical protein